MARPRVRAVKAKYSSSMGPFEILVRRVSARLPRGLAIEWVTLVLQAVSDMAFEETENRYFKDDNVADLLIFEGERRKKEFLRAKEKAVVTEGEK